jgi:molecular chaperone HscC
MIVGIDLGTTNSLVAAWLGGEAVLIPNAMGGVLTPSCVSLEADGTVLVGEAARQRLQTHPSRSAALFKRYMGSNRTQRLGTRNFRMEELSALILKSLKADAEAWLGRPVLEAVITVPAYFSDAHRKATRAAGELAGLKVAGLLNEPTAAALAYGMLDKAAQSRFLVFDLGGGTFDVSILEMFEGVMEVRATAGDNLLGGEDFVQALVDLFFARNELPEGLRNDRGFMQRLAFSAEAAKRQLGTAPTATITAQHGGKTHTLAITEPLMEQVCAPLLKRLRVPVERALRDARLRAGQLDNIVLAGGATRMPIVRRLATTMFGRFPSARLNPDEVVALGAAVQAGLKAKDAALKEVVLTDVAPYSLGLAVTRKLGAYTPPLAHAASPGASHGHFDPVIDRNSIVPVSRAKTYVPTAEGQPWIDLQIYQGEARMVHDNIHLGSLRVPLPKPTARHLPDVQDKAVEVRFTYDVNGLLQVEATVRETQETVSLLIENNPGLMSATEIGERLAGLRELKIHPRDHTANRTALARAERIYEMLLGEQREWLGQSIVDFEAALASQDQRVVTPALATFVAQLARIEQDSHLSD